MKFNLNNIRALLPEKAGRVVFDVLAVLLLPTLFALGYYFWSGDDDSALLSLVVSKEDGREYGAKAKEALARLRSIKMDTSLFDDPAYQSLKEFHVDIDMEIPLGRTYPFTPPEALRNKARPIQSEAAQ